MYGIELRDKFMEICRADLISRILNKANNNLMLLRKDKICKEHIGKRYFVYNGLKRISIFIKKNMLGFKVGEFIFSKKVTNMCSRKGRKSFNKANQKFRGKKKVKFKRRRKKQKKYIKNLKNKLIKLKKVISKLKKRRKDQKFINTCKNEFTFDINKIFLQCNI